MNSEMIFCLGSLSAKRNGQEILISNGRADIVYDLCLGTYDVSSPDKLINAAGVSAEVLIDGIMVSSRDLKRETEGITAEKIFDGFSDGVKISILNQREDDFVLVQNFYMYKAQDFIFTETLASAEKTSKTIKTNYISPFTAGQITYNADGDLRFLFVPFDNDDFVRYNSLPLNEAKESYEVTALYDNDSRQGMVFGSVTHDMWKTGILVKNGDMHELSDVSVFGGITSKLTRDTLPHGIVSGETVKSPKIFIGFYEDYRNGLEAYGEANAVTAPPLPWDKGIPMGWNSWSAVAGEINYDIYVNSSDFVKEHLQHNSFSADDVVYINFDACWHRLTEEEMVRAVKHVTDNNQLPGIYMTPFTYWGNDLNSPAHGIDSKYTWNDMVLKDEKGNVLPKYDGGYSIDPTHPGNYIRLKQEIERFKKWGFKYCKMDFLSHGTVEGVHYLEEVSTGIAAYNYGMAQIIYLLKEEIEKQEFFISLSIAPLFPSNYAHSRRISCDVFGTINWAEYMLNSLTYGWWMNRSVYQFNDPDHIVVYNSYNHLEEILFNEGLTRYISSAISGTMMIDSDDFRISEARSRCIKILTNEEINQVAKARVSFRPVEGNTGDKACDCFIRHDEKEGITYLAVFNFNSAEKKEMMVDLKRIGLEYSRSYTMYDLWSKEKIKISGKIDILLDEAQPRIYKIY